MSLLNELQGIGAIYIALIIGILIGFALSGTMAINDQGSNIE